MTLSSVRWHPGLRSLVWAIVLYGAGIGALAILVVSLRLILG